MNFFVQRSGLRDLYDKVAGGERISETDALRLFESKDLNAIGAIADLARQKKAGNRASYIINRYINYSNYCILSCQFCSFARKKRDADGFELTTQQIVEKAREALKLGITELHIVGGLHPSLPFSYYLDMLKSLRALDPRLQLKCFTAIEILHLAWLAKKSVEQTLVALKAAGLDSLTGGGAEIFRKEVRSAIARGKESAEEYLDVHRTWHRLGGRSTCTMLFGHVESLADRVDHLRQLRALQDETHGFVGFVPLPYQPEDNDIPVEKAPTGFDSLRTVAISRIYLDNFDHITAYWVGMGLKLAQVALSYGADDLHGTIIEEHIFHMAGATSPQLQTEAEMLKAIREAGRTPVQRNTFYEPIKIWDAPGSANEADGNGEQLEAAGEQPGDRLTAVRPIETLREKANERYRDPGMSSSDETPKLRMAPPESAEQIARRLERDQKTTNREREFGLEQSLKPFRVGSVRYLNAVPLTRGLEDEIVFATPAKLAEMLQRDELDAALVSVTEVLFNDRYDILDSVAIASLGEVKSVLLAHRKPLKEAREIFCDPASLTSVNLLRVLLAERGLKPEFKPLNSYHPGEIPDFALLIGDPAIDFLRSDPPHDIWDLGAAWLELTNLPFVYAVWALRRGVENTELRTRLLEARDFGLDTLDAIIQHRTEYDLDFRQDYLGWHIHYHLGADEKRGLARFIELLKKHGLGPVHDPKFVTQA